MTLYWLAVFGAIIWATLTLTLVWLDTPTSRERARMMESQARHPTSRGESHG